MARRIFTMARPTVVFPLPDSPTRPSVSPRSSVKDKSSTARTSPVLRSSTPPNIGNLTFRFLTSRMGGICLARYSVQVAPDEMSRSALHQRGLDARAGLKPIRASRRELAAGGEVEDIRHRSGNGGQALRLGTIHAGQRAEEPARIRVHRILEELPNRRKLLNFPAV